MFFKATIFPDYGFDVYLSFLEVSFRLGGIYLSMNIIYSYANFPISDNFPPFIENNDDTNHSERYQLVKGQRKNPLA